MFFYYCPLFLGSVFRIEVQNPYNDHVPYIDKKDCKNVTIFYTYYICIRIILVHFKNYVLIYMTSFVQGCYSLEFITWLVHILHILAI